MDKSYPSPMPVVRSLDAEKDSLNHGEDEEEMLGPRVPYLNAIGPANTSGSESRIYFDISKTLHILTYYFNFSEI